MKNGDLVASFDVLALVAAASAGQDDKICDFGWSESLNYGIKPNPSLPTKFMVEGYDIGAPWPCVGNYPNSGICNTKTAPYNIIDTKWVEGPIHCRVQIYVGQRYARDTSKMVYGNDHIYGGPIISGCEYFSNDNVTITFNKTL